MEDTGKQRLRPWLEALINSGEIEGLYWLNPQRNKFRIPWFHSGKPDWIPERGQIFKEWAIHTGRYREGVDEVDWVGWKTRLRCALNKATDIVELKKESNSKADDVNPFRVYELRSRQSSKKKKEAESRQTNVASSTTVIQAQMPILSQPPIPAFLTGMMEASEERIPDDLIDVHNSELLPAVEGVQLSAMSFTEADPQEFDAILKQFTASKSHELIIDLYYCNNIVWQKSSSKPSGVRLYYGDGQIPFDSLSADLQLLMIGEHAAETIWLPPVYGLMADKKMEPRVQMVLERGMERGILLQHCSNGNIVAYRLCKCSIYHASYLGTDGHPVKLPLVLRERDSGDSQPTVIFDYCNQFLPALNAFALNGAPQPDPRVFLLIGTEKKLADINNSVPIYATVSSSRAMQDLENVTNAMKKMTQVQDAAKADIESITGSVEQMSLESMGFSSMPEVPGYELLPEVQPPVENTIDPPVNPQFVDAAGMPLTFNVGTTETVTITEANGDFLTTLNFDQLLEMAAESSSDMGNLSDFSDLIKFQ